MFTLSSYRYDCLRLHFDLLRLVGLMNIKVLRVYRSIKPVLGSIAGWKSHCAEYFPCSTYFEGKRSSVMPDSVYNSSRKSNDNGDAPNHPVGQTEMSDGQVEAFKSLSVST